MAEEAFISLIESRRMLYDKTDINFNNANLKDAQWNVIGSAFKISGKEAQLKFKALRQKYVREKNLENTETRSGAGSTKRTKWAHMSLLRFLDDHIKPRKTISNLSLELLGEEESRSEDILEESFQKSNIMSEVDNFSEDWVEQVESVEQSATFYNVSCASSLPSGSMSSPTTQYTESKRKTPISSCAGSDSANNQLPRQALNIPSPAATVQNKNNLEQHNI